MSFRLSRLFALPSKQVHQDAERSRVLVLELRALERRLNAEQRLDDAYVCHYAADWIELELEQRTV